MILDTNSLSALLDGEPKVRHALGNADPLYLPVVVIGEYRFGLLGSKRRNAYESLLQRAQEVMIALEIREETAHFYADIRAELKAAGRPIPANDLWIAALARQHQMPLVSRDAHFDHVPGLRRIGF